VWRSNCCKRFCLTREDATAEEGAFGATIAQRAPVAGLQLLHDVLQEEQFGGL